MNIKKTKTAMLLVLFVLIILIAITVANKNKNKVMPQDIVFDFFTEMTEGNFREAMEYYIDNVKESQIDTLERNMDLYKCHWANVGVRIDDELIEQGEGTAEVTVTVSKYNVQSILGDITIKLLNVNSLKEDGTYITEEEMLILKKQYIKEAYLEASERYKPLVNEYVLKLEEDDEIGWKIVNSNEINYILFGSDINLEEENN